MNQLLELPFPWLAEASLRLALLLAAFLLARPLLRRLIGSQWLSLLWLVLLVRLLAPWPLATPFGWESRAPEAAAVAVGALSGYEVKTRVIDDGATLAVAAPVAAKPVPRSAGWREVWLAGVALGFAALGLRMARTARLARRTEAARDIRLLAVFAELPEALRRGVELRETDALSVPTLAGLVRPQIWMPRAWLAQLSEAELRHVLLHELGHARRRDLLVQWLFSLAVCVHWFNPLVWLAARCARADREMACDAWVLARSRNVAPDEYGATLLKTISLLREPLRLAPQAIAMAASKRGLFTRIATLGGFRAQPAWRGIAGLLALAAALAALTTTRLRAQQAGSPAPVQPADPARALTQATVDALLFGAGGQDAGAPAGSTAAPAAGNALPPSPRFPNFPQIEIASRFVEITDSTAKELALSESFFASLLDGTPAAHGRISGVFTTEEFDVVLRALNQRKGVDLLSAPRVTTKSGQRAVIEIIREFRYPTEFDNDGKTPPTLTPTAFETRNVGITLEVQPTLGPDGATIDLELVPQAVELTGFNRVGPGGATTLVKVPAGNALRSKWEGVTAGPGETLQPIFSTRKITTNVSVFEGQTIVIGGLRKEGEIDESGQPIEPRQLLVFVTATLLKKAPLPEPEIAIASTITEHRASGAVVLARPSVVTRYGQRAAIAIEQQTPPGRLEAAFHAQRDSMGAVEVETTLARTGADGKTDTLSAPKLKMKLGQLASIRVGDLEIALTVTQPEPPPPPAQPQAVPLAIPVNGKPGFVSSPFAPNAGYIDVRGFPPGTEVKCPYSGKIFAVP